MVQGFLPQLEQVEARQKLMASQLEGMKPAPVVVNLTWEEDKGGVGGPIFLAPETLAALVDVDMEREEAQQGLIAELDHLLANFTWYEELKSGEYTPTRPSAWGPEF